MVSGKTHEFLFSPQTTASEIAQYVFDHWPNGKINTFNSNTGFAKTDGIFIKFLNIFRFFNFVKIYLKICYVFLF